MNSVVIIDIFNITLRSLISLVVLFISARLMGKKQISQLNFLDYVVGISIGSIAASFAVDDTISYSHGLTGLIVYSIFPIVMSQITLKSIKGRKILGDTPTILIQNGKFVEGNLKKSKFNVNDVLEELRLQGVFSFKDVEFAILETSGKVSIQLKSPKQPVTCEDLELKTSYKGIEADLILDGQIIEESLCLVGHDKSWLLNELKKQKINSPREVLLATLDSTNKLNIDLKNKDPKSYNVIQ